MTVSGSQRFPLRIDNYKPLREIVFEALREAIVSGRLAPGERLMEIQLAEEMGVSRTPVREAIRKLELEGFVVMIPRKGTYVAELSLKEMSDVFEIRAALEELAAELAAERVSDQELEELEVLLHKVAREMQKENLEDVVKADIEFHEALFRASRNARLSQIISQLREQIHRYRTMSLSYPGRIKVALEEHRRIVEAVAQRNPELARQAARDHIDSAENSLMEMMTELHSDPNSGKDV